MPSRCTLPSFACGALLAAAVACGDTGTGPNAAALGDIAFSRSSNGYFSGLDLFVTTEGGTSRRIVSSPQADLHPDWSPDGRQLLFTRPIADGSRYSLWVARSDGSAPHELPTGGPAFGGRWSPDGQWIAFVGAPDAADRRVWIMRSDGSELRTVSNTEAGPNRPEINGPVSWSADGILAYTRGGSTLGSQIELRKLDGTQVPLTIELPLTRAGGPRWSRDGSLLAFHASPANTNKRVIVVAGRDGSNARVLTDGPLDSDPAWSPDDRWLLFDRVTTDGSARCALYKVSIDGGAPMNLTPDRDTSPCAGSAWRTR